VKSTYKWYWLVDGLMDKGCRVSLANPAANEQYSGLPPQLKSGLSLRSTCDASIVLRAFPRPTASMSLCGRFYVGCGEVPVPEASSPLCDVSTLTCISI
jgi:hypothetical protein